MEEQVRVGGGASPSTGLPRVGRASPRPRPSPVSLLSLTSPSASSTHFSDAGGISCCFSSKYGSVFSRHRELIRSAFSLHLVSVVLVHVNSPSVRQTRSIYSPKMSKVAAPPGELYEAVLNTAPHVNMSMLSGKLHQVR